MSWTAFEKFGIARPPRNGGTGVNSKRDAPVKVKLSVLSLFLVIVL
jgi:hypothetical protein